MTEFATQQRIKTEAATVTPDRIMQMAFGFAAPLMMHAAIQNRVFDVLDNGPLSIEEVCRETGASERGIRALLNGLVALDILETDDHGRYQLSPDTAAYLVSSKTGYHGELIRHFAEQMIPNWLNLDQIVRSGKPTMSVTSETEGQLFFERFVESLFPMNYPSANILAETLNLTAVPGPISVLDLAAGSGVWGIALAKRSANVTVTAVDWQQVIEVTKRVTRRWGVADQFRYVVGDLQQAEFGTGHAVAILGHILHSEGEMRSRALLRKVYQSLAPGGTICIADFLTNETHSGPPLAVIFAVNMLVHSQEGDTYSYTQIASWLADAGFTNPRTLNVPGPSPLILATKW